MQDGQLYLATVKWRACDVIADIAPGKLQISDIFTPESGSFEAHIPAYAREGGRDMQLAIRSSLPCAIVGPGEALIPLAEHVHADTGARWWIEKGPWVSRGGYHDAPSFHRPGGIVKLRIGEETCLVHLYDPSITQAEFSLLMDDIKNWCWRMAIDEACYVTVEQGSEVRVLSTDYLRHAQDFIRNMHAILETPHCELRESIAIQRIDRLRPNNHSLRFLAQRGDRPAVPGRSARQHYNTSENRFARAMLKRVISMLHWTAMAAADRSTRFQRTATQYDDRATELRTQTAERIDPSILSENLHRCRNTNQRIQQLRERGFRQIQVTSEQGDHRPECFIGFYDGDRQGWTLVWCYIIRLD